MAALEAHEHAITRRSDADRRLVGLVLVGVGILWLVRTTHVIAFSAETLLALLLMLLGGGLLLTARRGQRLVLPAVVGVVLTLALVGNSNSFRVPRPVGLGRHEIRPLQPADVMPEYHGSVGNLLLDLRQLPQEALDREIAIRFGVGSVLVLVQPGTDVEVDSHLGAGKLTVCGVPVATGLGLGQSYDNHVPGALYHLRLVISDGVGDVQVEGCQPAAAPASKP